VYPDAVSKAVPKCPDDSSAGIIVRIRRTWRRRLYALGVVGFASASLALAPTAGARNTRKYRASPGPNRGTTSAHRRRHARHISLVGKVLLNSGENDLVCQAALDGTPGPRRGAYVGRPDAFAAPNHFGGEALLPDRRLLVACSRSITRPATALVAFDLINRKVVWKRSLRGIDTFAHTARHAFLFSHSNVSPSGLIAGTTSYTLTAVDVGTGKTSWSAPFTPEAGTPPTGESDVPISEGPSGVPGHPQAVVVSFESDEAYDARTGAILWQRSSSEGVGLNASYVTAGIAEAHVLEGLEQEYGKEIRAFTAATATPLWQVNLPVVCFADRGGSVLVGTVEWEFAHNCLQAHDVATGQMVVPPQLYPPSWTAVFADPAGVVAYDGSRLSMFAATDLAHSIWSVPAGPTTPLAVSTGHVLVNGPSGLLVLNSKTGAITGRVAGELSAAPEHESEAIHGHPVGGLVEQTVLESKTRVLDLDAP
jgi:hypothetical protein